MAKTSRPQVIVITDKEDAHLRFVLPHLSRPPVIIDPRSMLESTELSYSFSGGATKVTYAGSELHDITGVWFRKPRTVVPEDLSIKPEFHEYAVDALRHHIDLLNVSFPEATWASDYYKIIRANNKSLQLELAGRLGFNVPDTLFTSDSMAAKQFITSHKSVVMKPYRVAHISASDGTKVLYANLVNDMKMPRLENLHISPLIFQQAIHPKYELRITVVGTKVFPARIAPKNKVSSETSRDWRMGHFNGGLDIGLSELPAEVRQQCVNHVRELGLKFGAIDMIVDQDNKHWFLENNPNGQWAFIEAATGQQIGKAIAELLEGHPTKGKSRQI